MMEAECAELDVKIELQLSGQNTTIDSLNKQLQLCQQLKNIETEIEKLNTELDFINTSIITQVIHNPDKEATIKNFYQERLDEIQKDIREKVQYNLFCLPLSNY